MEQSQAATPKGKVSQVFAAALGSVTIVLVNRNLEPAQAGAAMYFIPVITLLASGLFGELEERIKESWSDYREKSEVKQFVVECDDFLKDENLDDSQKEEIIARKNQARMSVINNKFQKLNKHAPTGTKIKPKTSRRVNPKTLDE
ncbi:hypothetical protein [Pseudomonas fluorescens]|uniref:Uncharacterized protein n=1 Tax=Pseudomonas fluorescens TaxID=294 RepID=A0A944DNQ0_PSEFL|nr:hypothetical protein [Pseudomonas fluorescens]MBT2295716.1 hypothetical protein [Pseudomonas fluorescens]MBT2305973.1 hypothetical protein [Pseudomonas fluorescens]MBT2314670.1 hypothetical protein [Pseudomonas fluorescens]MBT2315581.1 hypothetical protein [Pseudomonas fluorescens]MBT2331418.1 hypothetical protein [Pseudomonas fluorescens]